MEDEKPRFIKQLTNIQVTEGQTTTLDCVVTGRPEPEVVSILVEVCDISVRIIFYPLLILEVGTRN